MGMGQMSYTVWLKFRQLLDTCPQIPQVDLIDEERMFHDHSGELMVQIVTYIYIYTYVFIDLKEAVYAPQPDTLNHAPGVLVKICQNARYRCVTPLDIPWYTISSLPLRKFYNLLWKININQEHLKNMYIYIYIFIHIYIYWSSMNGPCSFIFHRKLLNSRFWPEKLIATVGVGRDDPWMPGDFNPMWSPAWETRGHQTAWELGNPQDEMSSVYATLPKNSHSQQSDWSKMMTATSWLDIDQITT